jgi:hypothetical protein
VSCLTFFGTPAHMTVSPVPLLHLRELDIQTRFLTPRVIDGDIEDVVRTLSNV